MKKKLYTACVAILALGFMACSSAGPEGSEEPPFDASLGLNAEHIDEDLDLAYSTLMILADTADCPDSDWDEILDRFGLERDPDSASVLITVRADQGQTVVTVGQQNPMIFRAVINDNNFFGEGVVGPENNVMNLQFNDDLSSFFGSVTKFPCRGRIELSGELIE
jgi:hypothetical protein